MIVVDASVIATAVADDGPAGDAFRERLRQDADLHVPHLLDLEVISALRRQALAGLLGDRRAGQALGDIADLPLTRYVHPPLADRVWELRQAVTAYDGVYVALAELLACPLLTADGRLARASGPRCPIELLQAG